MYPIRSFISLLLIFFSLSLLGEFVVGPWMGDAIPTWKILAVSLITALSSVIPLQKRGLSPGDIFKYFRRSYIIPGLDLGQLLPLMHAQFPQRKFSLELKDDQTEIRISRKANWQSFGEIAVLRKKDDELIVRIRPKYYLDVFDQGQAYESLLRIEKVLKNDNQ